MCAQGLTAPQPANCPAAACFSIGLQSGATTLPFGGPGLSKDPYGLGGPGPGRQLERSGRRGGGGGPLTGCPTPAGRLQLTAQIE